MMKKLTSLLLSAALMISLLACGAFAAKTKSGVRIAGLKGPTTMGLVNLLDMERSGKASQHYDLQLYGAADEIVPKLIKGELDMAAIPANLAATLYQKTNGGIQVMAVNTLGVLYVVEKGDSIHSFADLKGRTILSTGKGTTPEHVLRYLLTKNGLDPDKDVKIEYYSEASEVTAQMAASKKDAIAVLPQPYVTAAQLKDSSLRVVLDLTKEWNKVCDTQLITGVTVVRTEYAKENPDIVANFLRDYEKSIKAAQTDIAGTAAIPQFYQGELQGRVLVDGQEISNLPMYQIAAKVGSVFQNPRTQFFNVDTDSEIAFGIENEARPVKELEERVEQTTKDLHIEKLRNRNIFELSGGEKQKIAFASVYAMNPEIYLLDEPSSNLDMASIQELKEHLRLIKSQGKTILIAEHRLYYLMELADHIVYLEDGEIARIFTPDEFLRLPETEREHMGLRAVDLARVLPPASHPPISSPTLALHDVTLRYKKRTILHQIALSAAKGEVIGVVGHNGAGKTTFSRALCGLHKDCEGAFLWDDQPMEHKARLKRSYMVMQDVNYELFAESVGAECSFGIRNPDQDLVEETMKELGLTAYRERHPNTLSGGQKQRVAVAVSMICGKDLLVFDEPTSGLDFDSMAQVAGLIKRLSEQGKIIFIVTHDFEFVCRTCSRVLHFDEGEMPDDIPVVMDSLQKLRELFSVSERKEM